MKKDRTIFSSSSIEGEVIIVLTEQEARALHEMSRYSLSSFIEWFYKNLGTHYIKPHEPGLKSLWGKLKKELPPHLNKFDRARKALDEK